MPAISDLQYGFDSQGVETYLKEIKSIVLTKAADALDSISGIKSVCEKNWEGKARDDFIVNLEKDKDHVKTQFQELYKVLEGEIEQVEQAMANKDRTLIN